MKKTIAVFLAILVFAACFPFTVLAAEQIGTVNSHVGTITLRVRTGPGTNYSQVEDSDGNKVSLEKGTTVIILDKVASSSGDNSDSDYWYKISVTFRGEKITGYVASSYIDVSGSETPMNTKAMIIADPSAQLRSGAGTSYDVVQNINFSETVSVEKSCTATDGSSSDIWYYISVNGTSGYLPSSSVKLLPAEVSNGNGSSFEEALAQFPESYHQALRALHEQHPNWQFVALKADESWSTVIKKEMEPGINLTDSSNQSLRSTDESSYNWATDTFKAYDANSWFQVKKEVLEYYMDPRNFLTEGKIFQFESLAYNSATQTISGVQKIIGNSFMNNASTPAGNESISYAEGFMRAAALSGVSPYHLASKVIQEVGNSGSGSTSGTYPGYEGYYNYFNIGAYSGDKPIANGLKYAKNDGVYDENTLRPWNTPLKSIFGGAITLGRGYINRGQNTLYLEKYDITDDGNGLYWHQYMTNVSGAYEEGRRIYSAYSSMGILDASMTFIIPVFDGMPSSPCSYPNQTGNPNNVLSSLTVDGKNLVPEFTVSKDQTNYTLVLTDETSLTVSAATVSSKAQVAGDLGTISITPNQNRILRIKVTAENGDVRDYTIQIVWSNGNGKIYGDVNGDGKVSDSDVIALKRYISNWNVTVDTEVADANLDGATDDTDVILISRYISGWKVSIGQSN